MRTANAIHALAAAALSIAAARAAFADLGACAADSVAAGTTCLDRYEASVWRVPDPNTANASLVAKIRLGSANRGDLTAGRATPLGIGGDDYAPCTDDGQSGCGGLYAVSIPSVLPSASITWFQAQEACANSGKQLPTNAEWQIGANGTPDPGPDDGTADCNTTRGAAALTGERSRCTSARGASDTVGNLAEWVADWVPLSTDCPGWASFSDDAMCLAGANLTKSAPGALLRGGGFSDGAASGPFSVSGAVDPTRSEAFIGFRCARPLPEPASVAQLAVGLLSVALLARRREAWKRSCDLSR
jgi:hypothetical protein